MDDDTKTIISDGMQLLFTTLMERSESLYLANGLPTGPTMVLLAMHGVANEEKKQTEVHLFRLQTVPIPMADEMMVMALEKSAANMEKSTPTQEVYLRKPDGTMEKVTDSIIRAIAVALESGKTGGGDDEICMCESCVENRKRG